MKLIEAFISIKARKQIVNFAMEAVFNVINEKHTQTNTHREKDRQHKETKVIEKSKSEFLASEPRFLFHLWNQFNSSNPIRRLLET